MQRIADLAHIGVCAIDDIEANQPAHDHGDEDHVKIDIEQTENEPKEGIYHDA